MSTVIEKFGPDSFFTKKSVLETISIWVKPFVKKNDLFIDFSCGKNEFIKLLRCKTKSYDIVPAPNSTLMDWFRVIGLPKGCIIGLNPPFGYQGKVSLSVCSLTGPRSQSNLSNTL